MKWKNKEIENMRDYVNKRIQDFEEHSRSIPLNKYKKDSPKKKQKAKKS